MAMKLNIVKLEGVKWNTHEMFKDFIKEKEIEIGDPVKIENQEECGFHLEDNELYLTFEKMFDDGGCFFTEEAFTIDECKILFGNDFEYKASN